MERKIKYLPKGDIHPTEEVVRMHKVHVVRKWSSLGVSFLSWWQWLWKICFPPLHVIARVVYACLGAHGRVYFMTRKVCSALLVVQDDIVHSHHQTLSSHKRCLLPFIYRLRVQESNSMPPHTMKWNYREANACDSISFSTAYWILETMKFIPNICMNIYCWSVMR